QIGEGAHGVVLKALFVETGEVVALKKLPLRRLDDGVPASILREIKALMAISHPNVVKLRDFFPSGPGIVLVFEYMLSDLAEVLRNASQPLGEPQVKAYMAMLLRGVAFCHSCAIMHRDLKPANLLISPEGVLKLADFGLARVHSAPPDAARPYSHQVATRRYGPGVDLWAVGCIFAELLNHAPLFPGQNDIDQLYRVHSLLGTPRPDSWPELETLPDYNKIQFPALPPVPLEKACPDAPPPALALLRRFLVYPAADRIQATD
ncbi:Cyclin-dependent kinase 20, partial [Cladochytrium tenue]